MSSYPAWREDVAGLGDNPGLRLPGFERLEGDHEDFAEGREGATLRGPARRAPGPNGQLGFLIEIGGRHRRAHAALRCAGFYRASVTWIWRACCRFVSAPRSTAT